MTSRYHGGKISRSQQSFLTETAICVVERRKKSLGYRFAPECNHAQESHTCQCCPRICGTTVCWGPDIMLPWQLDVTTSPLYRPFARWRHFTSQWRWEQVNCGFICSRERNEETGTYESTIDLLPTSVAQLVEHRSGDREVTGSNPVEVLNFFQASLRNCINCVHFDDHFFIFKLSIIPKVNIDVKCL